MTAAPEQRNESDADDPRFSDLLDDLLTQMLEGEEPDLEATAGRHPAMADRIAEALALAGGTAGRRQRARPSLQGYEILHEIGRGGMGTVYLARQTLLDREVALKVLPHSFGLSPRSRQRFLSEARALAKLEHEHVIGIHRILDDGEVLAFEMEYVDGPSLHDVLNHLRAQRQASSTPPTLAQVADLLRLPVADLGARNLTQFFVRTAQKIGRALGAVHAAGLVHRDVKPGNVLLRRTGEPVLVDFGLARLTDRDATHTGGFSGTPVYSAPEQLRGDTTIGPPADVYGLAVTLYECLTLTTPFAGRSTTDQLRRIENGQFPPLRRSAPGVPRDLVTIVGHAMEVEPEQRYADGTAFADDLQRLLDLQPVLARPAGSIRRFGKLLRRQRNSWLAGCLGAVLVTAAMVPMLGRAEAATRRQELAREHLQTAQQNLIAVDSKRLARHATPAGAVAVSPQRTENITVAPLRAALAEYESALELDPENATARREHGVVRLALWLRQLTVPDVASLQEVDNDEFRRMTADLGPFAARAALRLARGTRGTGNDVDDLTTADADDCAALGLLQFLFGDFRGCEDAWQGLPPPLREQPLVDAALGLIHRADGMPDLAYVRLSQAQRHFHGSATLRLELAESALAMGDVALARHWVEQLDGPETMTAARRRLDLDLRSATMPEDELAAAYNALAETDPLDPTPRHRLALLALRRGDLEEAARRLDALLAEWPDASRFRLDRARVALQQRDLPAYARQALAVLQQDFGRHASRGTTADLLEILRIGGLTTLHREATAELEPNRSSRAFVGGEIPIRGFSRTTTATFEGLLRIVHAAQQRRAELQQGNPAMEGAISDLFLTVPLVAVRLPGLPGLGNIAIRSVAWLVPWATYRIYPHASPILVPLLFKLRYRDWREAAIAGIGPPEALPREVIFGNALLRIDDCTGDGIDDLLIAAETTRPEFAMGRVYVVDGRSRTVVDTMLSDSEEHMFGHALANCGDLDGDGTGDWLIGAPVAAQTASLGFAEVWSGRTRQVLCHVEADGNGFGVSVTGLGDVDADGTPDFAVATSPLLRNTAAQGCVRIYSGRSQQVLHTLRNDVAGVWFGAQIAAVDDADGDGVTDLVVGGNFSQAPGLVRLYSSRTGAMLQTWTDASPTSGFGTSVLGVGDVDGDGRGDVVVTAVRSDDTSGLDQVFLFSGADGRQLAMILGSKPGERFGTAVALYRGSGTAPLLAISAPRGGTAGGGSIDFFARSGHPVSMLLAPQINDHFGGSLATGTDLDGDGWEDLFVADTAIETNGWVWRVESKGIQLPR